jgi:hypothetical protein
MYRSMSLHIERQETGRVLKLVTSTLSLRKHIATLSLFKGTIMSRLEIYQRESRTYCISMDTIPSLKDILHL